MRQETVSIRVRRLVIQVGHLLLSRFASGGLFRYHYGALVVVPLRGQFLERG